MCVCVCVCVCVYVCVCVCVYVVCVCVEQTLSELDSRVSTFYQHYLVVEVEPLLRDTAAKLKQMTQQTFSVNRTTVFVYFFNAITSIRLCLLSFHRSFFS